LFTTSVFESILRWFYDLPKTKEIYDGELKDGKKHGYGKLIYDDATVYTGFFFNGLR